MKICETYVYTLYYQQEETHIAGSFIYGGSEIEKNDKDYRKETQSKQRKDEEVNATSLRDIRIFFEKQGTISRMQKSSPLKRGIVKRWRIKKLLSMWGDTHMTSTLRGGEG